MNSYETVKAKADVRQSSQYVRVFHMNLLIHKEQLWRAAQAVLAVALASFVLSQTNLQQVVTTLQHISLPWLLAAILAYCAQTWVMARRYWLLLGRRIDFHQLLTLVIIQTSLGNLITTSTGAISYLAVLRARYGIRMSQSIASLFVARLADALVLFSVLLLSSWMVWSHIERLQALVLALSAFAAACLVVLLGIYWTRHMSTDWASRLFKRLHADETNWCIRLNQRLTSLGLSELGQWRIDAEQVLVYSLLYLLLNFAFAYSNVQIFSIAIGIWPLLFMLALTEIVSFIPLQVFGGLGVYDVTILYLYELFGFPPSEMAAIIISMRLLFYGINLLLLSYLPLELRLAPAPLAHEGDVSA